MSSFEKKEQNLNQLIDKLNSLSLSYSQPSFELEKIRSEKNEIVNQNTPIQLARGSQQLTGMLYSTQIDLNLDPLHHFPPGSWPCAPGTPQGQNCRMCDISARAAWIPDL